MESFTPIESTIGGILIGLSAIAMLALNGRIAGISGIAGGLLSKPSSSETPWRVFFVIGLVVGGLVVAFLHAPWFAMNIERSTLALAAAGLIVGFGTRLGSGCTSGHGVCGISRLSTRSIVATVTFMMTGAATVFAINRLLGGSL